MIESKYPIVNDYLNLVERAEAIKDQVRKSDLEAKALRVLASMNAPASREAVALEEAARANGRARKAAR